MFVKPKPGLRVRRPEPPYPHIPEDGAEVSDTDTYWNRRLADGDVVLTERPAAQALEEGSR